MAEVKDLENVEQEATAPAMEETAADSAAPAPAGKAEAASSSEPEPEPAESLEEAAPDHPPVHTGTAAGDRRGGAAESAGRQEQR